MEIRIYNDAINVYLTDCEFIEDEDALLILKHGKTLVDLDKIYIRNIKRSEEKLVIYL